MTMHLVESKDPTNLQEALYEVVQFLDAGEAAFQALARERGDEPFEFGRDVQQDLLAVARLLDSTEASQRVGAYLWSHRYYLDDDGDDHAA